MLSSGNRSTDLQPTRSPFSHSVINRHDPGVIS
jgi:hypothetical protein